MKKVKTTYPLELDLKVRGTYHPAEDGDESIFELDSIMVNGNDIIDILTESQIEKIIEQVRYEEDCLSEDNTDELDFDNNEMSRHGLI